MDKKGLFNFPVLDFQLQNAENYTAWALTMQYNFLCFRSLELCSGHPKMLVNYHSIIICFCIGLSVSHHTTSAVTQDQWVRTDEQIMAYIMWSVSIPIRLSIGRSTSSREQWLVLSRMFVQIISAREYQLCQALQEAKQEDRSIQDFYSLLFRY